MATNTPGNLPRRSSIQRRIGKLRVQVDRWPVTGEEPSPHLLTVILVGLYARKPDVKTISQALLDAIDILQEGEQ